MRNSRERRLYDHTCARHMAVTLCIGITYTGVLSLCSLHRTLSREIASQPGFVLACRSGPVLSHFCVASSAECCENWTTPRFLSPAVSRCRRRNPWSPTSLRVSSRGTSFVCTRRRHLRMVLLCVRYMCDGAKRFTLFNVNVSARRGG